MKGIKSEVYPGVEFNNPEICIKGAGTTFACVCPTCMKEMNEKAKIWIESLIKDWVSPVKE